MDTATYSISFRRHHSTDDFQRFLYLFDNKGSWEEVALRFSPNSKDILFTGAKNSLQSGEGWIYLPHAASEGGEHSLAVRHRLPEKSVYCFWERPGFARPNQPKTISTSDGLIAFFPRHNPRLTLEFHLESASMPLDKARKQYEATYKNEVFFPYDS
jgi:hypothetical protein